MKWTCKGYDELFDTEKEALQFAAEKGESRVYEVSACCESEVGAQTKWEITSDYRFDYEVECCTKCGKEVER